ncbi:MAG: thermonuclease family protein [Bacteroidia bacterium]
MKYLILAIIMLAACIEAEKSEFLEVRYVIDGDTIIVEDGSNKGIKVRLIGINAPESRDYKHRKKEAFGEESSDFLKQLLENQKVQLSYDVEELDQYGRHLAYVYLENGKMVNNIMLRAGYAELMTINPNVRHVSMFVQSQTFARENRLGIWSQPD